MSFWWVVVGFVLCIAVAYRALLTFLRAHAARIQIDETVPFEQISSDYAKTLLVLGDSTAVGVGASKPEESVAGRLAAHLGATYVENRAASGAATEDLKVQMDHAARRTYDVILIQIGGNDIIMLRSAKKSASALDLALMELPEAKQVYLMSAGNVGGATTFPLLVRVFHTWSTKAFHSWFTKVAKRRGITYVNLYEPRSRDLFISESGRYLSADGLHPSSEGYALWFEKLRTYLT